MPATRQRGGARAGREGAGELPVAQRCHVALSTGLEGRSGLLSGPVFPAGNKAVACGVQLLLWRPRPQRQ